MPAVNLVTHVPVRAKLDLLHNIIHILPPFVWTLREGREGRNSPLYYGNMSPVLFSEREYMYSVIEADPTAFWQSL